MGVLVTMSSLVTLILIGLPIAVALAMLAAGLMWFAAGPDLLFIFIQRFYTGMTSFSLLAIPFFILAGNLMNTGGMTHRIFNTALVFVGRVRGGLGHVNVVGSMLFSGMSGSAVADSAGLGVIEVKAMREAGYSPGYAAAITAASSTIGPVVPPSIPFVIYGSLANVSVGALFLAGILPGILMGISMMVIIALTARAKGLPKMTERPDFRESVNTVVGSLPALVMPVFVVGGLLLGWVTPTEAAVIAAAYAAFIGIVVYRELRLSDLPEVLWTSGRQAVQVLFIMAAAAPFSWVLVQQQVPNAVVEAMLGVTHEPWAVLLMINAILLILGMFIEGIAVMVICMPMLMPVVVQMGIDPVHFGVIVVLNLMIGLITPPVGLCLYTVSQVANVDLLEIIREISDLPRRADRRAAHHHLRAGPRALGAEALRVRIMTMLRTTLTFADRLVAHVTRYGVILCLSVLFFLLLARVIARATEIPFATFDEIGELATVWMIMLGAVALWRDGALYRVEVLTASMPGFGRVAEVLIQLIMLAFAVMLVWVGGNFTAMSREVTAFMQIDKTFYYGAIPVAGAVMALYSVRGLIMAIRCAIHGRSLTRAEDKLGKPTVVEHL
ncbi:TRAP transporter large permease subunit [Pseudooceanicola sp. LIPI14-2-Ac024]|uniref:TRAP transporter large permease subunit n=1 Tax=Pseudooceanicola sp. LIPI14-2-Ac024 TaxID=3344875 RepID=UPI0035D0974C